MKKVNVEERKKAVLAMERLVRSVNDEELIDSWLRNGVADGDIDDDSTEEDVDDCYIEDDTFSQLMSLFLSIMTVAKNDGGLYINGVTSR